MEFRIDAMCGNARACTIQTAHSTIKTPVFMPVGTLGSVKSLDVNDLLDTLQAEIILANTYHMYLRPGDATVAKLGKLHGFTKYPKSFLTDSGGFQAFSLSDMSQPKTNGIEFRSHIDGSKHFFTPKKVLDIQYNLGSDIMMILDDLVALPATLSRGESTRILEKRVPRSFVRLIMTVLPLVGLVSVSSIMRCTIPSNTPHSLCQKRNRAILWE